jgi:hypothetical protein
VVDYFPEFNPKTHETIAFITRVILTSHIFTLYFCTNSCTRAGGDMSALHYFKNTIRSMSLKLIFLFNLESMQEVSYQFKINRKG